MTDSPSTESSTADDQDRTHSSTVENYIKHIYLQGRGAPEEQVPMKRLADAVGVSPGTATSMVKGLARSGLISYEPRGGTQLTTRGQALALSVLRRHRLVELFLVEVLKLDWSEVHREAETLEHAISDKVLDRLDELMGHPSVDPHGDPIPTVAGDIDETHFEALAARRAGDELRIVRVTDQDANFLRFADREGLVPGTRIRVDRRDDDADSLSVTLGGSRTLTLGASAAAKILVVPLPD